MPEHAAGEARLPRVGRVAVIASAAGLVRADFLADGSPRVARSGRGAAAALRDRALAELAAYPGGGPLDCPVDLRGLGPFATRVLRLLAAVPRGRTVGYGELAALAGSPGAGRGARGRQRLRWEPGAAVDPLPPRPRQRRAPGRLQRRPGREARPARPRGRHLALRA